MQTLILNSFTPLIYCFDLRLVVGLPATSNQQSRAFAFSACWSEDTVKMYLCIYLLMCIVCVYMSIENKQHACVRKHKVPLNSWL